MKTENNIPKRPVTMWLGEEIETAERLWKSTTFRSRADLIRATLRDGLERTAKKHARKEG